MCLDCGQNPAYTAAEAVERLNQQDPTLTTLDLERCKLIDADLTELVDCLLAQPNILETENFAINRLTDETGVKVAHCLAGSSTVQSLSLSDNEFGEVTYLALATALRTNSSLRTFDLYNNQAVDQTRIDAAFVEALRLNPDRPIDSEWWLYSISNEFDRLKQTADELGHPSLKMLLVLC